jgi:hypothetical protein
MHWSRGALSEENIQTESSCERIIVIQIVEFHTSVIPAGLTGMIGNIVDEKLGTSDVEIETPRCGFR